MPRFGMSAAAAIALLGSAAPGAVAREGPSGPPLHVAPPVSRVAPGGSVRLRALPAEPAVRPTDSPSWKVLWAVRSGPGCIHHDTGEFTAPYVVPPPGAEARIIVWRGIKPDLDSAEAVIQLEPGSVPGAEECLGPGQAWGCGPSFDGPHPEELAEALTQVPAEYPAAARARQLSGTLGVNALVCRSGRVMDVYASWPLGAAPEPLLEEAALDAARQWIFKPASVAGQPIAVWVTIPFRFPPP